MTWWRSAAVLAFGLLWAVIMAASADTPMGASDIIPLVATGFGCALIVGAIGAVVLRRLRGHGVQTQAAVVALVSVVGTGLGVAAVGRSMFISPHDLDVLMVVLIASGTVGVLAALLLGDRIGQASRSVEELTRRIGAGEVVDVDGRPATEEFGRLATELHVMSARLDQARERERALDQSRRQLVAWVSHDLRTPLAGIRAIVEALDDGVVDDAETTARYHTTLRSQAERLTDLVDDLFELSRIHAGGLQLEPIRVGLDDLVSESVATVMAVAEAKGVRVTGDVDASIEVEVSPSEIGRVLVNLLGNAVRHSPSGGEVRVVGAVDGDDVMLQVRDQGGGVEAEHLEHIFDPGFQGDAVRTPGSGSGLGLAIARGFVEAHGGEISAENIDGGACFTVCLPRTFRRPDDRVADAANAR